MVWAGDPAFRPPEPGRGRLSSHTIERVLADHEEVNWPGAARRRGVLHEARVFVGCPVAEVREKLRAARWQNPDSLRKAAERLLERAKSLEVPS